MLPPWGLMLTRPGETAMSAGAMFKPCGETLTPVGDTEIRVCAHKHHFVRPDSQTTCSWRLVKQHTLGNILLTVLHAVKQRCTCMAATIGVGDLLPS